MKTTDPEGEWTKQIHKCERPSIPDDADLGSEWTCHCGRVWVVHYQQDPVNRDRLVLIPKPTTLTPTTWTINQPPSTSDWTTLR